MLLSLISLYFFFHSPPTTEIYTLSLHDALPISANVATITTASNPLSAGLVSGRDILIEGFTGSDFFINSTYTLTNVTPTTIQFSIIHAPWTGSTNGVVVQRPTASAGCNPTTTQVFADQAMTSSLG